MIPLSTKTCSDDESSLPADLHVRLERTISDRQSIIMMIQGELEMNHLPWIS
jgi:hypothetical protein